MFDEKTLQNLMQQSINETVEHELKEVLEKGSMPQLQTLLENLFVILRSLLISLAPFGVSLILFYL